MSNKAKSPIESKVPAKPVLPGSILFRALELIAQAVAQRLSNEEYPPPDLPRKATTVQSKPPP